MDQSNNTARDLPCRRFVSRATWYQAVSAFCATALLSAVQPALSGDSAASAWADSWGVSVRLISAGSRSGDRKTLDLGLEFLMEEGWHIYWNNPTGFSYHPSIVDNRSRNIESIDLKWPIPTRIEVYGQEVLGYKNKVVLPLVARVIERDAASYVSISMRYLACSEICVPTEESFDLAIPANQLEPTQFEADIVRFARAVPKEPREWGVNFTEVSMLWDADPVLRVVATSSVPFLSPDLLVGGPDIVEFKKPQVTLANDGRKAIFDIPALMVGKLQPDQLFGSDLTLLLSDRLHRVKQTITIPDGPIDQPDM